MGNRREKRRNHVSAKGLGDKERYGPGGGFFRRVPASQWSDTLAGRVLGGLQLVPCGAAHRVLADDYERMLADGMLLDESEPFDALMERCAAIEIRANETR